MIIFLSKFSINGCKALGGIVVFEASHIVEAPFYAHLAAFGSSQHLLQSSRQPLGIVGINVETVRAACLLQT